MKLLSLSQIRFLRFTPWSSLAVLLGMILGIGSIVAVHQISQRVVTSLDSVVPPYLEQVSFLAHKSDLTMADYFSLRRDWRAGRVAGLAQLMPLLEGTLTANGRTLRIVGLDGFSGFPEALGLALLPVDNALVHPDLGVPEGAVLRTSGGDVNVAMVSEAVPMDTLLTDIGTAQVLLGKTDTELTAVALLVDTPWQQLALWGERLLPGLSAGFTVARWELAGWQLRDLDAQLPSLGFARSVLFNLGALGSLALVVSWLLVYQVAVVWLRRRQLTFSRLRQMGVTNAELRRGFLAGLFIAGLVAGLLGVVLGQLLAALLVQTVSSYAGESPLANAVIDGWVIGKALGSAILVSVAGGWLAFQRETRAGASSPVVTFGWLTCFFLVMVAGVWLSEELVAGFASIAAAGLVVVLGVRPLLTRLRSAARHLGGRLLARIGLRELLWYPNDLATAVGALALALATSVAIALMVDSFRADFERMLDRRMVHDLFVVSPGRDLSEVSRTLRARSDVQGVQAYGRADHSLDGFRVQLSYSRFDREEAARYGVARALDEGEVIVSERLARRLDLAVGDEVGTGQRTLVIVGVFAGFGDAQPRLLMDVKTSRALGVPEIYDRLSIRTRAAATVMTDINERHPDLSVEEHGTLRAMALEIFDRTFAVTQSLTLLALLVAGLGLYNALLALALQLEPSRLLLNAMGVSRDEHRAIARWRIVGVGGMSILLALPLGLVMGWLLCRVINPRAFGWSLQLLVESSALVWPVVTAVLAMVVVALLPVPRERGET